MPESTYTQQAATTRKSGDERKELLARVIQQQLAQGKMRVETRGDYDAVLVKSKSVNLGVGAHILLTLITMGLWLFAWIPLMIFDKEKRYMITVDEFGISNVADLS